MKSEKLRVFIGHLNQPGFEVGVDKNIKSIKLKTIVPGGRWMGKLLFIIISIPLHDEGITFWLVAYYQRDKKVKTDLCGTNILHAELTGNSTLMIALGDQN